MYCITGGCGFIGSHIAQALVQKGEKVRIIDNLSSGNLDNIEEFKAKVEFIEGDIREADVMRDVSKGVDYIIHQAALVSVGKSVEQPLLNHEINVTGTINVLEAARANNVKKVVMASSAAVYGNEPELPKRETQTPVPVSPYGLAKYMDEQYAALYTSLYGVPTACLRYFNVFGPRQDPRSPYSGVLSIFSNAFSQDKVHLTLFGDGLQTRDFVYVKDVVQANLLACTITTPHAVFNVGTGVESSLLDVIDVLQDITAKEVECDFKEPRKGDIKQSVADISLLSSQGYIPKYSLEEGLHEYWKLLKK